MRFAFILFNSMTALDFVGAYDPLTRLRSMGFWPDLEWDLCAASPNITDDRGLRLVPTKVARDLNGYDVLVVPGGFGTRALVKDADFIRWLQTAGAVPLIASVCTGALLLGAAGFLRGRKATTHPAAYAELATYGAQVVEDGRVVDEGPVVTSRGVTAAIDLGLYLVSRLAGSEICEKIRRQMDYPAERVSFDKANLV